MNDEDVVTSHDQAEPITSQVQSPPTTLVLRAQELSAHPPAKSQFLVRFLGGSLSHIPHFHSTCPWCICHLIPTTFTWPECCCSCYVSAWLRPNGVEVLVMNGLMIRPEQLIRLSHKFRNISDRHQECGKYVSNN